MKKNRSEWGTLRKNGLIFSCRDENPSCNVLVLPFWLFLYCIPAHKAAHQNHIVRCRSTVYTGRLGDVDATNLSEIRTFGWLYGRRARDLLSEIDVAVQMTTALRKAQQAARVTR